ncbi:MAG: hypothetical protein H7328_05885 [Bdellovibrio sp.]|nr:hypothetical protein [Bdellovibrio sp.]
MKSLLSAIIFTVMGSAVLAGEFEIIGSVYQNPKGEKVFVQKTKEDIQMCIDICIQSFDTPGAELKACVTKCAN